MIGRRLSAGSSTFSSEEIGIKNLVFRTEVAVKGRVI